MKEYIEYKKWWMTWEAPSRVPILDSGETEDAFEQHINEIGLYQLMETLADWGDD